MALARRGFAFWVFVFVLVFLSALAVRVGWVLSGPGFERAAKAQDDCTEIETFEGEGSQQTSPFQVTGDSFRLDYSLEANTDTPDVSALNITVYDADSDELVNLVTLENPGSDSSFVNEGAGSYYLDIGSANGTWTVTALDCGSSGGEGVQYQEGGSSGQDSSTQYQDDASTAPPAEDPSLFTSGGPEDGPAPAMPGGSCPPEYPEEREGGCWR